MLATTAILIVNWNLKEDTLACIRSLLDSGAAENQIFLVDNASTDGSPQAIRSAFAGVHLVEAGENLGLSGGINLGLAHLLAGDWEWVFLLNNDTITKAEFFDRFADAQKELPEASIWGPRIRFFDDPARTWFLGENRVFGTLLGRAIPETYDAAASSVHAIPVDYLSGCAMLVRREVFETIGGFDSSLFLFAEEVDFCHRAAAAGFSSAAAPLAGILHKVSLSTDIDRPMSRYYRLRNQIWFYRRYSGPRERIYLFTFTLIRSIMLFFSDLFKGNLDLVLPLIRGWFSGWFTSRKRIQAETKLPNG